MERDLCIECKKAPVGIKKRMLCVPCYHRWYRDNRRAGKELDENVDYSGISLRKYGALGEIAFIKNYFTHNNWVYEPCGFKLNGEKYTPDFYDAERGVFTEVSSTRQAFYGNRSKYRLFKMIYPQLAFEIRLPNGDLIDIEKPHWLNPK